MIHEDCYGVIPLRRGEFNNEVHRNRGEGKSVRKRRDRVKRNRGAIWKVLGGLASSATINIIKDEFAHTSPPELMLHQIKSFETSRVAGRRKIVEGFDQIATKIKIRRYIKVIVIKRDTILHLP